jgi:hypothetical protein
MYGYVPALSLKENKMDKLLLDMERVLKTIAQFFLIINLLFTH